MAYLHGAYGQVEPSGLSVAASSGTLPVYFGVAPIHQLADYTGKVGVPIMLRSASQARAAIGYSPDWPDFTLSEPEYLHFMSAEPAGPIAVVNVFDPDIHKASTKTSASVVFVAGKATLVDAAAIVKTFAMAAPNDAVAVKAVFGDDGKTLTITDATGALSGELTVSYYKADVSAITPENIVAAIVAATPLVYQTCGVIPSIMAAPGHSLPAVNTALKSAAQAINGHFNAFVYSDIECVETHTIDAAIAKKSADLRTAAIEVPCWPMATDGEHVFHLSTLSVHRAMLVDAAHEDIPYETASNKEIPITGLVVYDNAAGAYINLSFDKLEANRLNAKGIRTAIYWGGSWRLWGPHTGAYDYDASTAPEEIFDCSVRMMQYQSNNFALRYGDTVDKPMHRALVDSILDAEQERLDALVNIGALLYGKIEFVAENNNDSDMMSGQFKFATSNTTTPAARAIINEYKYTSTGLAALTAGGSEA